MAGILTRAWNAIVPPDPVVRYRRLELIFWGAILSFTQYPGWFGAVAWVALARPLALLMSLSGRAAFTSGYLFAFTYTLGTIYWVAQVTPPGMIAAVAIVAIYYALAFRMMNRLYQWNRLLGLIAIPILFTGVEHFRTLSQFAFPWSDLGYTQVGFLAVLQWVSLISVHGLTLLIVAVNVLVWQVFRRGCLPETRLTFGLSAGAVVTLLVAFGWVMLPRFPEPGTQPVAMLQGNVPLDMKWDDANLISNFARYDSLAQQAADSTPLLIVWPETAVPCWPEYQSDCLESLREIVIATGAAHTVGGLSGYREESGTWRSHNSVFHLQPNGLLGGRHDKVKLVPFAEAVPYEDYLPFLRRDALTGFLTFIETHDIQWWSDYRPGDSIVLFDLPEATYGVLICFESAFPNFARDMVRQGSDFLVGITNDTWFEGTVGMSMHTRIFITRIVENRIWGVRAANSGDTFVVDPYGRIHSSLPRDTIAALIGKIRMRKGESLFASTGDVAGQGSLLLTLLAAGILVGRWIAGSRHSSSSSV